MAATLALLAGLVVAGPAAADATVTCRYDGKKVQTIISNSKDGPRSCNAVCVWHYRNIPFRGVGGAMLDNGETKAVFNATAPYTIDGVVGSDINCNR
jgi:hypothetical protein